MKCDRERLSHYLDGQLGVEAAGELRRHLDSCEQCRADLAIYRQIDQAVGQLRYRGMPDEVRRAIFQKLEEQQRARARRSLIGRIPASSAAVTAASVLLAGSVGLMQLVPRGAPPTMTAAFAVQETPDSLDGLRVELVFDRPVAADSVAQAVVVDPPLPLLHRVHQNKVELIPGTSVSLGSSYRLVVDQVRDERGNTQSEPVALHLATWPVAMVNQASAPPALPRPGATQASGEEKQGAEANGGLVPAPLTQRPPAELRSQLGLPLGSPKPVQITEQTFQGGAMLVRSDSGQVLVLNRSTARWDSFASTWRPGEVLPPVGMARPPGTFEPLRALGKVWREQPAVKLQLGWPVFEERLAPGSVQSFENGVLIHSSFGLIYALFHDGAWRTLPDPRR